MTSLQGSSQAPTIYYLLGRGGQSGTGLSQMLLDRGYGGTGREFRGDFASWVFSEQVTCVADDVGQHFWRADALVIVNSWREPAEPNRNEEPAACFF